MKKRTGLLALFLTCALLLAALSAVLILRISGNEPVFTGQALAYFQSLKEAGFPEDYATSLTKLHLLHPEWEFVPLKVTETDPSYTWDYVIGKETENPKTNLISSGSSYSAYRHPTNRELYDSGFYQASKPAVSYFMDPRNFLNETDIFQFYDLNLSARSSGDAVRAVLAGTFMENANVGNGKTYADYLVDVGVEVGIDPVYLAVKLRQEQGTNGTSPIISGKCGTLLLNYYLDQTQTTESGKPVNPPASGRTEEDLLALNGYYNPFNVGAGGTGVFAIYENAMIRARKGTESKTAEWGSPSWNTIWKGIYGGAEFLQNRYISQYQSTIYLQKFNVDGHVPDKNFWSQYMQNVTGALSEGRTLYRSFAADDALDMPCRFLIPVYEGMPKKPCADPAGGSCASLTPATERYSTSAAINVPFSAHAENNAVYGEVQISYSDTLTVSGKFTHTYGIRKLQYAWDGAEWNDLSSSGDLSLSFSGNLPDYGSHMLVIRGEANDSQTDANRKSNRWFLCAVLDVTVVPPPSATLTLQSGNAVYERKYYVDTEIALPVCNDEEFAGWIGSDGSFLPSGAHLTIREDVHYKAFFLHLSALEGASLPLTGEDLPHLRFYAVIPEEETCILETLPAGSISLLAQSERNGIRQEDAIHAAFSSTPALEADHALWRVLAADTPSLSESEWSDLFSMLFLARLHYTDGSEKDICAQNSFSPRSAVGVARAALSDTCAALSDEAREKLALIAS